MRLDRVLLAVIVLIFAVHAFGTALSWYFIYPWMDILMHIAGGFWLGLLFIYLFAERHCVFPADSGFLPMVIIGLGFVALIGIGWEMYEYLSASFLMGQVSFGESIPGVHFDTLKDLFNDLLGGLIAISLYFAIRARRAPSLSENK